MEDRLVTVMGPTGKTGRHVVQQAVERGWTVRAAGRRPAAAGEWVPFEWDDPGTWEPAFAGSDAAYILIPFNHPGAPERAPEVIEAAVRAGVPRIALLSTVDVDHAPDDDPTKVAERTLAGLPVRSTMVRPTWFLDNFTVGSFKGMLETGELRLPAGDGLIPFVDTRDVAAVAVAAMAAGGPEGVLPVTGPAAVDHHVVAEALADALDVPMRYVPVSGAEFVDLLRGRGFATEYGEFLAEALIKVADGRLELPVSDTVPRVVGRPAYSVSDFARDYAVNSRP
ncbi:NAD(P)H-binding protein [Alloactinosynnema sp. L-07]|uniref:NAD(P)H-binding protein n=1 Tax=Alloactinosynnema sp. L-07 TaxID=1653480 RepID=UPI00155FB4F5|nr:NAD(P)H-binding protein [Alloactinosynnema sp. L-07]